MFRGEPFKPRDPAQALAAGVGVVFQELPLLPDMTVMENIYFGQEPLAALRTISKRRMRARAQELFDRLLLPGIDPTRQVRELSIAARQLVAIAKVLAADPAVVIFDEATSALGPSEVAWLFDHTRALAAAGKGIVFISHRLAETDEVSDRVTVLRNGRGIGTWAAGEISRTGSSRRCSAGASRSCIRSSGPIRSRRRCSASGRCRPGGGFEGSTSTCTGARYSGSAAWKARVSYELFLATYGVIRSRGSIAVGGVPRRVRSPRDALRAGIGLALVPEDRKNEGILPTLSIRENMSLPSLRQLRRLGLISGEAERKLIRPAMADLRIGSGDPEQQVGGLSGGNQQKVVVGKFLLTGAKILLLYDLTRGVDVGTKAEIFRMMDDLAAQGYAILFYSSDLAEIENVPHRICVMFEGQIVATFQHGSASQEDLVAAMVGGSAAPGSAGANGATAGPAATTSKDTAESQP